MRFLEDRTPEEMMAALGITRRQYARLLDRAIKAINRKLCAYLAGDWCPGYASRFARLAAGRATAEQAEQAQQHLAACPACRHAYGDVHTARTRSLSSLTSRRCAPTGAYARFHQKRARAERQGGRPPFVQSGRLRSDHETLAMARIAKAEAATGNAARSE